MPAQDRITNLLQRWGPLLALLLLIGLAYLVDKDGKFLTWPNFANLLRQNAVVGIIALAGIEVKNSILLVDYTEQLRANGATLDEAIQEAGETRFVPIILTTLTAIGGLIPLAIEWNPLYSPLAWVLIGGLISSTLLTRVVTPVLYKILAPRLTVKAASVA